MCVCVFARARLYALKTVSLDKILRFTNTLIIIKQPWCLTSTETIRFIGDVENGENEVKGGIEAGEAGNYVYIIKQYAQFPA